MADGNTQRAAAAGAVAAPAPPPAGAGTAWLLLRVFLPFAGGYYLSYLYRSINALLAPELARDFGLTAGELGLLTSTYFISFAAFQIPLGILLDWAGPRRVNAALLVVAAAGAALFASADGLSGLLMGRALIGLGVSACLMASIKAFSLWFALERLPGLNGAVLFAGSLGALSAATPLQVALGLAPWQHVMAGVAALTLLMSGVLLWVTPERAAAANGQSLRAQLAGVAAVLRSRPFWKIAATGVPIQAVFMSVQGLWLAGWLRDVAGLGTTGVANGLLAQAVAMGVGALSFGHLAEAAQRRGVSPERLYRWGLVGAVVCFGLMTAGVAAWPLPLVAVFALCSSSSTLAYALVSRVVPLEMVGRVNTTLNLLVFVFAFAAQWGMGAIIGLFPGAGQTYAAGGYGAAFGAFLVLQVVGLAWGSWPSRRPPAPSAERGGG